MVDLSEKKGNYKVSREEWVAAARRMLIDQGVAAVKIDTLARQLGVTRGGFYWFFKNRAALLAVLLEDWRATNTDPFRQVAIRTDLSADEKLIETAKLWIHETGFDPAYDAAVRDWARTSPDILSTVREVDDQRIHLFRDIYAEMGCDGAEALIRARVTYFHQIGYYSLAIEESVEDREKLMPLYMRVLAGHEVM